MSEPGEQSAPQGDGKRASRFFIGVLWNWISVAINLAIGILLSPYIVRKLGSERYGIWALVFSLLEYLWFFDLGFNTAVTKFMAHHRARQEPEEVNRVINTGLVYFCIVSSLFAVATLLVAWRGDRMFQLTTEASRADFRALVLITGLGWAVMFPLQFFMTCLDAYQRYDFFTRAWVTTLLIRSIGYASLLYMGYGLRALGATTVVAQLVGCSLAVYLFRSVFPPMRLSTASISFKLMKEMQAYGVHSFVANLSNLLLNQGPPVMIGYYRPPSFIGYYTFPSRILAYSVEAVSRVGFVTRSNAAEMHAKGDDKGIFSLGMHLNRYCVALFAPLSIFLLVWGTPLIRRWMNAEFAAQCGPLLPVMALSTLFAVAGQYNSSSILYALSRHDRMAKGMLAEGILGAAGILLVLPHYGILGVAWVVGILAVLDRGLFVPWLVCRALHSSFVTYMSGIYLRPALTAIPVLILMRAVRGAGFGGETLPQLILLGGLTAGCFFLLAYFTCITHDHRTMMVDSVLGKLRRRARA